MKTIFKNKFYLLLELFLFIFFFSFFIFFPLIVSKQISLKTQLSVLNFKDYLAITILSFLIATNLNLLIYRKEKLKMKILPHFGLISTSGILGIFSGFLSAAFCLSCLVPIFTFLGIGTSLLFFILKYKTYILIISILFLSLSLFFNLKTIQKGKNVC